MSGGVYEWVGCAWWAHEAGARSGRGRAWRGVHEGVCAEWAGGVHEGAGVRGVCGGGRMGAHGGGVRMRGRGCVWWRGAYDGKVCVGAGACMSGCA